MRFINMTFIHMMFIQMMFIHTMPPFVMLWFLEAFGLIEPNILPESDFRLVQVLFIKLDFAHSS